MTTTTNRTDDATRRAAARVPLELPPGLFARAMAWYSRRTYGDVLDNGLALLHNRPVLRGVLSFEKKVARWDALDRDLKALAVMAASAQIGCSWCMDFGYWHSHLAGMPEAKLRDLPRWRVSDAYTDLERDVIAFAERLVVAAATSAEERLATLEDLA